MRSRVPERLCIIIIIIIIIFLSFYFQRLSEMTQNASQLWGGEIVVDVVAGAGAGTEEAW